MAALPAPPPCEWSGHDGDASDGSGWLEASTDRAPPVLRRCKPGLRMAFFVNTNGGLVAAGAGAGAGAEASGASGAAVATLFSGAPDSAGGSASLLVESGMAAEGRGRV